MRTEATNQLETLATTSLQLQKDRKKIEEKEKEIRSQIIKIMRREKSSKWKNENETIQVEFTSITQNRFSVKKLKEEEPDLYEDYLEKSTQERLTIKDI